MGSDWDPSTAWDQTPLLLSTPTAHPKDPAKKIKLLLAQGSQNTSSEPAPSLPSTL